jgi:membrane fusion protein
MALFRRAALSARQTEALGKIVMISPPSSTLLATVCVGLVLLVLAFLAGASYTARTTVAGRLTPVAGLVHVQVPQSGIVVDKRVREGQAVRRGDTLLVISGERQSVTRGAIEARASEQIILRGNSLRDELAKLTRLQQEEAQELQRRVALLEAEQARFDSQLEGRRLRVQLAEQARERARALLAQQYVSRDHFQQAEAALLEQTLELQELERERLAGKRELDTQKSALASLPLRQRAARAQLERLLSGTEQELGESEARRSLAVAAPADGTVTAVTAEPGQTVDRGMALLAIIPRGSALHAELYAPSRAIGFIRPGQEVRLRYHAYPFQKFGHALGTVAAVTRTTLLDAAGVSGQREALYRVTVSLASQSVTAYGRAQPLAAGMALEADILHERRRLLEWVLEPVLGVAGKW